MLKGFLKGKRVASETTNPESFAKLELRSLAPEGQVTADMLAELLCSPQWVTLAGKVELTTGIPFFRAAEILYAKLAPSAQHLMMKLVRLRDKVVVSVFRHMGTFIEVTSPDLPKIRVRYFKERGTYSGLGAAHGAVYATMEYTAPQEAFSRIVHLCWADQRIL
jgi:hypothetical protein